METFKGASSFPFPPVMERMKIAKVICCIIHTLTALRISLTLCVFLPLTSDAVHSTQVSC